MTLDQSIAFSSWQKWSLRDRPADDPDVPSDFGLSGIYMLGLNRDGDLSGQRARHTDPVVLYIGCTCSDIDRLQDGHLAVRRYKSEFNDPDCRDLIFCFAHVGLTSFDFRNAAAKTSYNRAWLLYFERKLILEHAMANNEELPVLNRE